MTDDWRSTETEAESRTMLAALYRILEDARRYEQYAEVAQRAYDEELRRMLEEVGERSRQ
jgi:nicotinamide riboside kinase